MTTKRLILAISWILFFDFAYGQKVREIYKTGDLLKRISQPDTFFVVNFWATWCKPCVQELPAFDSLSRSVEGTRTKVLLVNLDFADEVEKRVNPFLQKRNINTECVLLDEVNGNVYIDRISSQWSGAIPATYFRTGKKDTLMERKFNLKELKEQITQLEDQR